MQRKKFTQLLLPALGYMIMGNIMSVIVTISLRSTEPNFLAIVSVLFSAMIYFILVAVPAYKDGLDEHTKSQKNKNNQNNDSKKTSYKWIIIGVILFAIMTCTILTAPLAGVGLYRMFNGATLQITLLIKNQYIPFVNLGFYALTVPVCHIGYILGLGDKLSKDKVLYK